jgi:hypothetical protein
MSSLSSVWVCLFFCFAWFRMNDKWSGNSFLLGFSSLANYWWLLLAQLLFFFFSFFLPTYLLTTHLWLHSLQKQILKMGEIWDLFFTPKKKISFFKKKIEIFFSFCIGLGPWIGDYINIRTKLTRAYLVSKPKRRGCKQSSFFFIRY